MSALQIQVEHNPPATKLETLGVDQWAIWRKEVSRFPWTYPQDEICYILKGRFTVTPDDSKPQQFQAGDLITFPAGLSCTWEIEEDVEKHYDLR